MTRTVLVTGSSSGFGRHTVQKFLAEGWNVVATLRDPAGWTGGDSDRLLVQALDVRDDASATAAVHAATERFGRLDVVVNNAGIGLFSVFETTPQSVIEELFDTNVYGPMRVIRAALPVFAGQGGGRIVNVTSSSATVPTPLQAAYGASKAAITAFSEALEYELADRNVQVRAVEPGFVPTTGFFGSTTKRFEAIPAPESYLPYIQKQISAFDVPAPDGYFATADDVAATVYTAATDTSGLTRFRVGGDTLDAAEARRRPDADYDSWRTARFAG
ncbi:SDR family oxidoreductase [Actinoplanes couchii]|uniref:Short-chain dehydrogenase/reductase n=1 Tax=Actinoplanes couchii TaxID=403638 RepID=A0ABQ3X8P9_9ACTN|nr:SDR family oxidoreductase [Actinoplanes couchii]MDR6320104.1 NAD(P)-dependent dehydrogenase (short-subunit alcohol dehydrogenase family) [Actinoplanes couchii]GID54881.1 short-chain dehydrogenase/reductase [Actinoplanes couchii]